MIGTVYCYAKGDEGHAFLGMLIYFFYINVFVKLGYNGDKVLPFFIELLLTFFFITCVN